MSVNRLSKGAAFVFCTMCGCRVYLPCEYNSLDRICAECYESRRYPFARKAV